MLSSTRPGACVAQAARLRKTAGKLLILPIRTPVLSHFGRLHPLAIHCCQSAVVALKKIGAFA
jgi:hypothetical protein